MAELSEQWQQKEGKVLLQLSYQGGFQHVSVSAHDCKHGSIVVS